MHQPTKQCRAYTTSACDERDVRKRHDGCRLDRTMRRCYSASVRHAHPDRFGPIQERNKRPYYDEGMQRTFRTTVLDQNLDPARDAAPTECHNVLRRVSAATVSAPPMAPIQRVQRHDPTRLHLPHVQISRHGPTTDLAGNRYVLFCMREQRHAGQDLRADQPC